ncbi:hypothetical protein GGQ74_000947 [Desulfobaculum xiamenense]|uniref:Uncharacterized protein n=1 Tax=Desulfobaculum xiamenense TaxID=995050 RepID=A0A846QJN2_9BACT|nr:hypothetical protein [Desulfobaculum xiamenense]
MDSLLLLVLFVAVAIILNRWVLPKLGIHG